MTDDTLVRRTTPITVPRAAYGMALRPRAYVAASRIEADRAIALAASLELVGFAIACRWWDAPGGRDPNADGALAEEVAYELATELQVGVLSSDIVIYLAPPPSIGRGCHFEAGMAIAANVPLIMSGPHARSVCFWALCEQVTADDKDALLRATEMCANELRAAQQTDEGVAWSCDHPRSVAHVQLSAPSCPQGGHVDHDGAPPAWCPLRVGPQAEGSA